MQKTFKMDKISIIPEWKVFDKACNQSLKYMQKHPLSLEEKMEQQKKNNQIIKEKRN